MQRYTTAGLTDRDVRRAMEAGLDRPDAIIAYCNSGVDLPAAEAAGPTATEA